MKTAPVAIVTGGSRGIGRAIVEHLHDAGWRVLFTHSASAAEAHELEASLNDTAAKNLTEQAVAHKTCLGLQVDVTDTDAPTTIFDAAEHLGTVTALINNAGITGGQAPLAKLDDTVLRRVLDVNLEAPIRLSREAARRWTSRDYPSHIVNVTSVAARTGSPNEYVAYAAAKGGLETFTVGLARELATQRIQVNAVSPGTIDTSIHARSGEPGRAWRVARQVPLGRPGQAHEIADAVAWLLSGNASYVTGAIIPVTGGL